MNHTESYLWAGTSYHHFARGIFTTMDGILRCYFWARIKADTLLAQLFLTLQEIYWKKKKQTNQPKTKPSI